jgi:hypothetical protein
MAKLSTILASIMSHFLIETILVFKVWFSDFVLLTAFSKPEYILSDKSGFKACKLLAAKFSRIISKALLAPSIN